MLVRCRWLLLFIGLLVGCAGGSGPIAPIPVEQLYPVVVITYNRAEYLDKTLRSLYRNMPNIRRHPVIISQDGTDARVADVIKSYPQIFAHFQRVNRELIPALDAKQRKLQSYYHIAEHYKFALSHAFAYSFEQVIIIEEDLEIAPDFFEYFLAVHNRVKADASVYAISAYNDNSKQGLIDAAAYTTLHRSDFFPGLGWLINRDLFNELVPNWPRAFWDDWMREPDQRKGRHTIIPEISRSHTFGKKGASHGQFFDRYLKTNVLADQFTTFSNMYEKAWLNLISRAKLVKTPEELLALQGTGADGDDEVDGTVLKLHPDQVERERVERDAVRDVYKLYTRDPKDFSSTAKRFGVMEDLKAGQPRGVSFMGICKFYWKNRIVLLFSPGASTKFG